MKDFKIPLGWDDQPILPPQPTNENPMPGPCPVVGAKCRSCVHIYELARAKPVRRCGLRGDVKHLMTWPACAKFEAREGPMKIYDGRR